MALALSAYSLDTDEQLPRGRPRAGRHLRRRHRHQPPAHRSSPPTTSAGPPSRDATRSWSPPGPTSSPSCTGRSSRSGREVVETDTFGVARPITLAEYGIADRAHELNLKAARIAREVADGYASGPGWPAPSARAPSSRRSARSASPSCATPTRCRPGACSKAASTSSSSRPCSTCCRPRPPSSAAGGPWPPPAGEVPAPGPGHHRAHRPHAARHRDRRRPHRPRRPAARRHRPQLRHRPGRDARAPPPPLPALPGADLLPAQRRPAVGGRRQDALRPHARPAGRAPRPVRHRAGRDRHRRLLRHRRPSTCKAVVERCRDLTPARAQPGARGRARRRSTPHVPFHQDTSFLVVGERTNANGSKKFRDAMLANDWDTCVAMARDQVKEGAHLLDVCVDYTGEDGVSDMDEIARRFATQASIPLVLDSTEPPVIEAGLQWIGGKAVLNSVNLEDGDAPGTRLDRFLIAGPRVRRRRRLHLHRPGGPGPHRRLEGAVGQGHPRPGRRPLRPGAGRPAVRRPGPAAVDRHGGEPPGRHRDHRGHPAHQGRAARRPHHPGPVQRVVRPQRRPPATSSTRCSCTSASRPASTPPSSTPARIMPLSKIPERQRRGLPRPHLRPPQPTATTRCRSCWACSRA